MQFAFTFFIIISLLGLWLIRSVRLKCCGCFLHLINTATTPVSPHSKFLCWYVEWGLHCSHLLLEYHFSFFTCKLLNRTVKLCFNLILLVETLYSAFFTTLPWLRKVHALSPFAGAVNHLVPLIILQVVHVLLILWQQHLVVLIVVKLVVYHNRISIFRWCFKWRLHSLHWSMKRTSAILCLALILCIFQ